MTGVGIKIVPSCLQVNKGQGSFVCVWNRIYEPEHMLCVNGSSCSLTKHTFIFVPQMYICTKWEIAQGEQMDKSFTTIFDEGGFHHHTAHIQAGYNFE